jgi:hypothetical protein
MAPAGQDSPQLRHSTCFNAKQDGAMQAFSSHGARPASSALVLQLLAQSPQKVHSPSPKFTWGKLPRPFSSIFSGQAPTQSPQRLHASTKSGSAIAQGGRRASREALKSPRRN